MDILVLWLLCALVGSVLTGWSGAVLGLLLGPLGVIIAIFIAAK